MKIYNTRCIQYIKFIRYIYIYRTEKCTCFTTTVAKTSKEAETITGNWKIKILTVVN